jgi:hypothetical protein
MTGKQDRTPDGGGAHRRPRRGATDDRAAPRGGRDVGRGTLPSRWPDAGPNGNGAGQAGYDGRGGRARPDGPGRGDLPVLPPSGVSGWPSGGEPVARRTATGWRVGDEEVSDLTSAMVLADLLAADLPTEAMPPAAAGPASAAAPQDGAETAHDSAGTAQGGTAERGAARDAQPGPDGDAVDPERLQVTVAQLEHALSARVRVEQAIGVLAERHRLRPRQAFELLRSVARASGRRVMEVATEVVDSATNPLLRIPEELAKPPVTRRRGRIARHAPENS